MEKGAGSEKASDCVSSRRLSLHELLWEEAGVGAGAGSNRESVREGKQTVWFLVRLSHCGEVFLAGLATVG